MTFAFGAKMPHRMLWSSLVGSLVCNLQVLQHVPGDVVTRIVCCSLVEFVQCSFVDALLGPLVEFCMLPCSQSFGHGMLAQHRMYSSIFDIKLVAFQHDRFQAGLLSDTLFWMRRCAHVVACLSTAAVFFVRIIAPACASSKLCRFFR